MSLDHQVGFHRFSEWWKADQLIKEEKERAQHGGRRPTGVKGEREALEDQAKERSQIQAAYESYRTEIHIKIARMFVHNHRTEEWFKERYVPEVRDPVRRELMDYRRGLYERWLSDVNAGVFDLFTLEGIHKTESDGAGGIIEKEEGETTAINERLSVEDLVPVRGGDLQDEALLEPSLHIKTLSPTVSRSKVEEFCKEHLGEADGGYKWLSLSEPNPMRKYHRIGWIILNPVSEEVNMKDSDAPADINGEGIGLTATEKAKEAVNDKPIQDPVHGEFLCHVKVHEPPKDLRRRALWDLFSAPERIGRDFELARRLVVRLDTEMGGEADGYGKIEERVEELRVKGALKNTAVGGSVSIQNSTTEVDMDGEEAKESEKRAEWDPDERDDDELLAKKKKLDLMVEYLRRVHNFCFFCVFECDSVHELVRKCGAGHLRRPRSILNNRAKQVAKASALGQPFPAKKEPGEYGEEEPPRQQPDSAPSFDADRQLQRAFGWVKTFEDKLMQILEPENVDLKKLGGKPVNEALEDELSRYVNKEDEHKYRCKVPECSKLFRGESYWRKHVEKRHPDFYNKMQDDVSVPISKQLKKKKKKKKKRADICETVCFDQCICTRSGTCIAA